MPTTESASWPDDADGDVFRRLAASGFSFHMPHPVEYNVDFHSWPPPKAALSALAAAFGELELHPPDGELPGHVLFREHGLVSYPRVVEVQRLATQAVAAHQGVCESWGILHAPAH
jgi:hypothetical protein